MGYSEIEKWGCTKLLSIFTKLISFHLQLMIKKIKNYSGIY